MAWKDLSYPLRIGIVLGLVYLAIGTLGLIFNDEKDLTLGFANFPMMLPMVLLFRFLSLESRNLFIISTMTASLIFYFLIGALIGWIVGKIKKSS